MTDIVGSTGASPESTYGSKNQTVTQPAPTAAPAPQPAGPNPVDLRLVIEDDQQAGCFVYKTVDWVTGQVVQQFPREQILKMREGSDYTAGDVIKSQA
jgi:flagellar protein FlaG